MMKTNSLAPVNQSQILKISLLVSILVSLSKTLFIYNMIESGKKDFTGALVWDLVLQWLFFLLFSWLILQLSSNWSYQFIKSQVLRVITVLAIGTGILLVAVELLELIYPPILGEPLTQGSKGFIHFKSAIIFVVLFFVGRILRLQLIQKESLMENEHLKQQNLQNELAALKNQIDPHFLFNSLNSLNSLLRDNKVATDFVTKLSFMYRYILQSGDRNLVSIKEELKFLDSYIYLIKTRYRDRFEIEIAIDESYMEKEVPPLALQLLVENAVKHNEISETNPLHVKIYSKDDAIYVENKIRPRSTLAEGTGNGLLNLGKRYILLGKQEMTISTQNNNFCVKLPFLKTA